MTNSPAVVAILLSDVERACGLREALAPKGIESHIAATSDELHRDLTNRHIDVVVIDQQLDGFLTGLEILERLKTDLFQPSGVIVGTLSPTELDFARRLGIQSAVAPDADLVQLASAVAAKLSQATATNSLIPLPAHRLVADIDIVRPLPQLLAMLGTYIHEDTASLSALANDIALDPRVTAELLKVTNSTATGLAKKVTNVHDAVKLLGLRRTIATILSAGVLKAQNDLVRPLPAEIRTWYQTRSVLIASTASCFAECIEQISSDTAHVLGLFQELGILVLANAQPRSYLPVVRRAMTVGQLRLEGIERDEFGITHADVSAALLQKWEVPQSIVGMVLDHHLPERRTDHSDAERRYLQVMRVAEAVANLTDVSSPHRHRALASLLSHYGPENADACKMCIAEGVNKTGEYSKRFSVPAPDESALRRLTSEVAAAFNLPEPLSATVPEASVRLSDSEVPAADASCGIPQGSPSKHKAAVAPTQERKQRVLVIDDETAIIKMLERLLLTAGFEVVSCDNGDDAEALAADIDIILCDVHLGDVNGIDVVLRLRKAGVEAPVIMVSGDRSRETVVECIENGIVDYVIKPFTRAVLVEKLQRHLGARLAHASCSAAR